MENLFFLGVPVLKHFTIQCLLLSATGLPHNEVVPRLKEKVMDFKQGMPVITSLRNQFLRPRHWQQIERLIGKTIGKDKSFTLGSLLEMNVRFMIMFKENNISL